MVVLPSLAAASISPVVAADPEGPPFATSRGRGTAAGPGFAGATIASVLSPHPGLPQRGAFVPSLQSLSNRIRVPGAPRPRPLTRGGSPRFLLRAPSAGAAR